MTIYILPTKTRGCASQSPETDENAKMAGVPQTKPGFAKNRVFATLMHSSSKSIYLGKFQEILGGRFGYIYIFFSARGVSRGAGGLGGGRFFIENPRRGVSWAGGGEGPGGFADSMRKIGGGGGLNIFLRGRNSHQESFGASAGKIRRRIHQQNSCKTKTPQTVTRPMKMERGRKAMKNQRSSRPCSCLPLAPKFPSTKTNN